MLQPAFRLGLRCHRRTGGGAVRGSGGRMRGGSMRGGDRGVRALLGDPMRRVRFLAVGFDAGMGDVSRRGLGSVRDERLDRCNRRRNWGRRCRRRLFLEFGLLRFGLLADNDERDGDWTQERRRLGRDIRFRVFGRLVSFDRGLGGGGSSSDGGGCNGWRGVGRGLVVQWRTVRALGHLARARR
jgi:hypothetical protein